MPPDDLLPDPAEVRGRTVRRAPAGVVDPAATPGRRSRIAALDVIRGFALCGILLANVQPIANTGPMVVTGAGAPPENAWMGLLVEQRFFPIFSLLFGIGFSLLLDSAAHRTARPRVLLLRRLLVLLGFGLAHMVLWRGDVLTIYAVVGLVVLLPSTWLPRWAVSVLAAVLAATSLALYGGGITLVPALFLLGSALTRFGVIDRIERSAKVPLALAAAFAAGAALVLWWQAGTRPDDGHAIDFALALAVPGLLLAGAYVCTLLVLLRTPLRPVLRAVFEPLGRMALTNYLTATVLVIIADRVFELPLRSSWTAVYALAGTILAAQWLFSTLWLRRYRQGPLEWIWRWATWTRRPPLRRAG
ncbi:hypothetical protein Sme01_54340 [Sphaerisporangium melleum]|uniref:DUF418 domain-containing protein n=1 Tax=Sphaerisporangium melleum TaxID=321316 RepID=A0A917VK04_9ACTN|nr:DUF418 domain-containing protein [Sphaerisporangium melleum]GGK91946.1 hypothetical protein GCM10007964_38200 [Sphaerisporangium melleum]GII72958.1 hypothetical protein Sme01_54340 [Sphaerisporangium melleum]